MKATRARHPFTLICLAAMMIWFPTTCPRALAAQPEAGVDEPAADIPRDFSVSVEWGGHGVVPKVTRSVRLSEVGKAPQSYQMEILTVTEERIEGKKEIQREEETRLIELADVRAIHGVIAGGGFFGLRDRYQAGEEVDGGGWLRVAVTADGREKSVVATNVRVEALAAIRREIEAVLARQDGLIRKLLEAGDANRQILADLCTRKLLVGSPGSFEKGVAVIELHHPVANFAGGVGDFVCAVQLDGPVTQEQVDVLRAMAAGHPSPGKDARVELVIEFLSAGSGDSPRIKGRLVGVGLFPVKPGRRAFEDANPAEHPFKPFP